MKKYSVCDAPLLDVKIFYYAHHAALREIRGKPEWRRLDAQHVRHTVTRAIISAACDGITDESCLRDLAINAVREDYIALLQ